MKMIDKKAKGKRVLYPLFFIVLIVIILFNVVRIINQMDNDKVVAYEVQGGWGYRIVHNDKTYIDQPFIPLLPGKNAFPDKKSALKTGKLVLNRLEKRQIPVITFEDLEDLKLYKRE